MKSAWLNVPNVKSTYHGLLPIKQLVPQIWKLGLQDEEKSDPLNEMKLKSNPDIQVSVRVDFVNSI